jgi:hypothetical protein
MRLERGQQAASVTAVSLITILRMRVAGAYVQLFASGWCGHGEMKKKILQYRLRM